LFGGFLFPSRCGGTRLAFVLRRFPLPSSTCLAGFGQVPLEAYGSSSRSSSTSFSLAYRLEWVVKPPFPFRLYKELDCSTCHPLLIAPPVHASGQHDSRHPRNSQQPYCHVRLLGTYTLFSSTGLGLRRQKAPSREVDEHDVCALREASWTPEQHPRSRSHLCGSHFVRATTRAA